MGLVDILWCCVSTGQYWLVLDDTGSVEGGTGWYLVVMGHYRVVLVETLRYWVSIGRNWVSRWRNWLEIGGTESVWSKGWYWSVLDNFGSVECSNGCYLVVPGQYVAVLVGSW